MGTFYLIRDRNCRPTFDLKLKIRSSVFKTELKNPKSNCCMKLWIKDFNFSDPCDCCLSAYRLPFANVILFCFKLFSVKVMSACIRILGLYAGNLQTNENFSLHFIAAQFIICFYFNSCAAFDEIYISYFCIVCLAKQTYTIATLYCRLTFFRLPLSE